MDFRLEPASSEDGTSVIDIFNYYVENTFAAYPEAAVPSEFFGLLMNMCRGYPFLVAKDKHGQALGFCLLRPHNPIPAFSKTAEITYFIAPEHTRKGIGRKMLIRLLEDAGEMGITSILAGISSLNEPSLAFHKSQGFHECGRFLRIGKKMGQEFDVVWMQRMI